MPTPGRSSPAGRRDSRTGIDDGRPARSTELAVSLSYRKGIDISGPSNHRVPSNWADKRCCPRGRRNTAEAVAASHLDFINAQMTGRRARRTEQRKFLSGTRTCCPDMAFTTCLHVNVWQMQ